MPVQCLFTVLGWLAMRCVPPPLPTFSSYLPTHSSHRCPPPQAVAETAAAETAAAEKAAAENAAAETAAADAAAGSRREGSPLASAVPEMPDNEWVEYTDPDSMRKWWWHASTGESTLTNPNLQACNVSHAAAMASQPVGGATEHPWPTNVPRDCPNFHASQPETLGGHGDLGAPTENLWLPVLRRAWLRRTSN